MRVLSGLRGDTPGSISTGSIHTGSIRTGFILPPFNRTSDISKCGTDVSTLVMALQGENFASRLSRLRPRTCSSQGTQGRQGKGLSVTNAPPPSYTAVNRYSSIAQQMQFSIITSHTGLAPLAHLPGPPFWHICWGVITCPMAHMPGSPIWHICRGATFQVA